MILTKRYVEIEWRDAVSIPDWVSIADIANYKKICISRGWLVWEDDEYYAIAASGTPDPTDDVVGDAVLIPKGFEVTICDLKMEVAP